MSKRLNCFRNNEMEKVVRLANGERPGASWGESGARDVFERERQRGETTTYTPPETRESADKTKESIDPGNPVPGQRNLEKKFPKLAPIIKKMDDIGNREFWNKNPQALNSSNLSDFLQVAEKMQETMLYRAIVENWDEETLYNIYAQVMEDLYTKCAGRPLFHEIIGQMKRGWHWLVTSEHLGSSKPNDFIEKTRKIKSAEKPHLIADLIKLEIKLLNGDDVCLKYSNGQCDRWEDRDDLYEDRLDFIQDELIAFYRNWIINKGIIENQTKDEIKDAYAKLLVKFAKSCEK